MKRTVIAMMAMMFAVGTALASGDHAESAKADAAKDVKSQAVCPVMGRKVNKKLYVDYKGERLYVCCQGCVKMVKKNPEKWFKKAKAGGVTLDKVPVKKAATAGQAVCAPGQKCAAPQKMKFGCVGTCTCM